VCEHLRVTRLLLVVLVALLAAGCSSDSKPVTPARAAPPQAADLDWNEHYDADAGRLIFGVSKFEVLTDGWRADISITNRTTVRYSIGDPQASIDRVFGLMLFKTGDLRELEQLNRAGELPAARRADRFQPELPLVLEPGKTWKGTMSARGALAAGRWLRVVFGPLVPIAADGQQLIWITDHAYLLRGRAGTTA
jgi:hypothetical protein